MDLPKERSNALNLMKIIMMIFVIQMHFLSHSGYLSIEPELTDISWNLTWITRSFIMVAVNCFVMITGFFQIDKDPKSKKCFLLIETMLIYSVVIGCILLIFGVKLSKVSLIQIVLPFSTKSYWFISCYIVLYLLSPLINQTIRRLSVKMFTEYLLLMLILFSVIPTLFNSFCSSLDDSNGFSVIWFIVLYSTGAWLRMNYQKIEK